MKYGSVWSKIEAVFGGGRVLRFTLEDVEMIWIRLLDAGLVSFPSGAVSA